MTALSDQVTVASHVGDVVEGGTLSAPAGQCGFGLHSAHDGRCGPSSPPSANAITSTMGGSLVGENDLADTSQPAHDAHGRTAGVGEPPPPWLVARAGDYEFNQGEITSLAETVTDLERLRIATTHRIGAINRGHGRASDSREDDRETAHLWLVADELKKLEDAMVKELERAMRKHPLGPWVKATPGLGLKQTARLLAAVGNPYWRPQITKGPAVEPPRPRRGPAELWAYCGFSVLPAGHARSDTQSGTAGGQPLHPTDQRSVDTQSLSVDGVAPLPAGHFHRDIQGTTAGGQPLHPTDQGRSDNQASPVGGVAPRRRKGQHANWNDAARMRTRLVAESCRRSMTSPYRATYEAGRAKYADAVHAVPCAQCGPKGKPAPAGSPLRDGHKDARALRLVAKEVLKDMFLEAKRWHLAADPQPADKDQTS